MKISVIVLMAGGSTRFGADKTSLPLSGATVRDQAMAAFAEREDVAELILAVPKDQLDAYRTAYPSAKVAAGGNTRQESVKNALAEVSKTYVLIHDGARPSVSTAVIDRVIDALGTYDAVVPVVDVADSLIYEGRYLDRSRAKAVQTPQGFRTELLKTYVDLSDGTYTDEGSLMEAYTHVHTVAGDVRNRKLTNPVDYYGLAGEVLTGVGYDIHRLEEGRKLVLAGVEVPYSKGAVAHSDGDCCLHALMDAMLSSVGLSDIGHYFPNTDEWKGANSADLMTIVKDKLAMQGASIVNASVSIVCERPKLAPYIDAMKARLADLLGISQASVGIAATTNEGVAMHAEDLVEGDAVAAFATVLVRKSL